MTLLHPGSNTVVPNGNYRVVVRHRATVQTDLVALLLNAEGKVRSDNDLIFFNKPKGAGVTWQAPTVDSFGYQVHAIELSPQQWEQDVAKLLVALTIDEEHQPSVGKTFGDISDLRAELVDANGNTVAQLSLGKPSTETGFLVAEVYLHRNQTKVRSLGQGYTNGLEGIVTNHGVTVENDQPQGKKLGQPVSLEKPNAPEGSVDMRKYHVKVALVKNAINGIIARVIMVMDASGSMDWKNLYKKQRKHGNKMPMQVLLERVTPVADILDDNHEMEFWFLGSRGVYVEEAVTPTNVDDYISRNWESKRRAGGGNHEPDVIRQITQFVADNPSPYPTLVLFWSDGGVGNDKEIERLIREAAHLPIFWMFLGIGKENYGALSRLDQLEGRIVNGVDVDNTGFEEIDGLFEKSDEWLYGKVMAQFAKWVKLAIAAKILNAEGLVLAV